MLVQFLPVTLTLYGPAGGPACEWPDHFEPQLPLSVLCCNAVCHLTIDCSLLHLQQSSAGTSVEKGYMAKRWVQCNDGL